MWLTEAATIFYWSDGTLDSLETSANFASGESVLMENLRFEELGGEVLCIYYYTHTHTHIHVCLYIMKAAYINFI